MKAIVIYAQEASAEAEQLTQKIAAKFGKNSVIRLRDFKEREQMFSRHRWYQDAKQMILEANIVVYAVSPASTEDKYVNWVLKKAYKAKKYITWYPVFADAEPHNECLQTIDKYTKEKGFLARRVDTLSELLHNLSLFDSYGYLHLLNDPMEPHVLLEQYKIYCDTAENLASRRQNVNSFYISAHAALLTIGATVFALESSDDLTNKLIVIAILSVPGIMLSISWVRMIQSYFIQTQSKRTIISIIEKKLAACMHESEWDAIKTSKRPKRHDFAAKDEKRVAWIFFASYAVIMLLCLFGLLHDKISLLWPW